MKPRKFMKVTFHLIFFITLLPAWVYGGIFSRDALYTSKDDVILVNATNFKSIVYGRQHAWLFQFFNQWCGHCVQFSKTYIPLASMVKPWKEVISLGAIDCAESANLDICRNFSVLGFPTLKFFPTNMGDKDSGELYSGTRSIEDLKQKMIEFVSSNAARPVSSWPKLSLMKNLNEKTVWDDVPSNIDHTAVILETNQSFTGREIVLGLMHLRSYIYIIRCDAITCKFKNTESMQTSVVLLISSRKGSFQHYIDKDDSVVGYIQYLEDYGENYTKWSSRTKETEQIKSINDVNKSLSSQNGINFTKMNDKKVDLDVVYLQDIENVIRYMYWQEVALHQLIEGKKLEALKAFTSVLSKYLPARKKVKLLLCHLNAWLDEQKDKITSTLLQNKLQELQIKYKYQLTMRSWMGCRGSQPFYRGYPCGLWTTFHALTVNNYLSSEKDDNFNVYEVLLAIRGYVINFFSCERCVKHFTKMSEELTSEVYKADMSILWLWQAHNKVNARLKGDETEDPFHPKQQYPPHAICSNCRRYTDDNNFQWDLQEVLNFLLSHYSDKTIMASVDEKQENQTFLLSDTIDDNSKRDDWKRESVGYQEMNRSKNVKQVPSSSFLSTWGLGNADVSLCIFIYISSILLLFICYFFILTRRRSLCGKKRFLIHH